MGRTPEPFREGFSLHWALIVRSCCLSTLLVTVVLPLAGIAFAVWLYSSSIDPDAAAARAYRDAQKCPTSGSQNCFTIERVQLEANYTIPGKFGSRTDQLWIKRPDGVRVSNVRYNFNEPAVVYVDSTGMVRIKVYRGLVTAVYGVDGTANETTDSPVYGSVNKGIAIVMAGYLGSWLLLVAVLSVVFRGAFKDIWRLVRKPTRPLTTYPDYPN